MKKIFLLGVMALVPFTGNVLAKADSVVIHETATMQWNTYPSSKPIQCFATDGSLLYWFNGSECAQVNPKKNKMQMLTTIGTIPVAQITCMASDPQGSAAWIGTEGGLVQLGAKGAKTFTTEQGLLNNKITALWAFNGTAYAGTELGIAIVSPTGIKTLSKDDGLIEDKVNCITVDNSGRVWVGTDKGISMYNGSKFTNYSAQNGLSWNETHALAWDARTNILWAAVGDGDINALDNGEWRSFMSIAAGCRAIMADSQSRIWFGSTQGLIKYNGDEWITDPAKLAITAAEISQLYCDRQGNLWFGTERGVIRCLNPYPY